MNDAGRDEAQLRLAICRVGRSLFERGHLHGTAGNISVRLPRGAGFLITATDACLGFLEPAELACVDAAGRPRSGPPPSKTLALHRRIYEAEPAAHCVLHSHATHLVGLTLAPAAGTGDAGAGDPGNAGVWRSDAVLPPITPYFVMKVGRVPLISYRRPGDPAVADAVAAAIATARAAGAPIRAVLCERLGPVVWHRSPEAAMATIEELEETARLWLMTRPRPEPLAEAQIDELRRTFGAHW